jgi:1,2-diacylglycerol 3-alpha-glucosyltransferase
MNIAIFTDTYFPTINGVSSSVYTLAGELKKRGHKVYVFTVSNPLLDEVKQREDSSIYRFPSVPLVFIKPQRAAYPFSIRLFRLIKKFKIDIIHTQSEFFMGFLGISASTSFRIPIVHTYHTMLEDYTHYIAHGMLATPAMARQFSKAFCSFASSIIVPTEKVANFLREYGVKKPIYVIPTGINFTPFIKASHPENDTLALKKKLNIDPSWPIILSLGRVAKEKSVDMSISQMPEIIKLVPEARLLIVGTGPDIDSLKELSESLNVADRVIFTGAVPYKEIGSYYQLGDVFLCCSVTETQGLTYYEAMAAGVPIIARRDDSIKKVIRDKIDGRLFDSPDSIPSILADLFSDPATAELYAKNAFAALAPFSSEVFGERVEDVYLHTIDRKRVKMGQKKDSMVKTPMPGALRHLRLETLHPDTDKKRNNKHTHHHRNHQ